MEMQMMKIVFVWIMIVAIIGLLQVLARKVIKNTFKFARNTKLESTDRLNYIINQKRK